MNTDDINYTIKTLCYVDPGNMLRTDDGRLVILDFGLMTKITDDQVELPLLFLI
jgi:predicted unusual protein kinase regulating ubiquinone biosynthesis (AarF/ABC1/UbiB family)